MVAVNALYEFFVSFRNWHVKYTIRISWLVVNSWDIHCVLLFFQAFLILELRLYITLHVRHRF